MHPNKVSISEALQALQKDGAEFTTLFKHGSLELEYYKPHKVDKQSPHSRDEVYIIGQGKGQFFLEGETTPIKKGDFLFVPAGAEHRFLDFTDDFATWVLFYGPEGGEKPSSK
ncbi:cupin domain-containing protein [Chitinophagales bacterium]|nr:cupin domain-containing protein [Chitinophagales bacterium]